MKDWIIEELKDIKNILAHLIGTAYLPLEEQFSKEALEKAAKAYQKLQVERGEWVARYLQCKKHVLCSIGYQNN